MLGDVVIHVSAEVIQGAVAVICFEKLSVEIPRKQKSTKSQEIASAVLRYTVHTV